MLLCCIMLCCAVMCCAVLCCAVFGRNNFAPDGGVDSNDSFGGV